jgi:hypothetical protein
MGRGTGDSSTQVNHRGGMMFRTSSRPVRAIPTSSPLLEGPAGSDRSTGLHNRTLLRTVRDGSFSDVYALSLEHGYEDLEEWFCVASQVANTRLDISRVDTLKDFNHLHDLLCLEYLSDPHYKTRAYGDAFRFGSYLNREFAIRYKHGSLTARLRKHLSETEANLILDADAHRFVDWAKFEVNVQQALTRAIVAFFAGVMRRHERHMYEHLSMPLDTKLTKAMWQSIAYTIYIGVTARAMPDREITQALDAYLRKNVVG